MQVTCVMLWAWTSYLGSGLAPEDTFWTVVILATGRAVAAGLEAVTLRAAPTELLCFSSRTGLGADTTGFTVVLKLRVSDCNCVIIDERATGA